MSKLIKGLIALVIVFGVLWLLGSLNGEKVLDRIEKPVMINAS
jgi:hypothetical protein